MFRKISQWILSMTGIICSMLCLSLGVFASNPIMGDETQGTVKLMTILLIGSAVMIVALVGLSAIKKGKK